MDQRTSYITTILREDDKPIAKGVLTYQGVMSCVKGLPDVELRLYYFAKVSLEPSVTFQHLSGVPLSAFLDHSYLTLPDSQRVGPLTYIHGKSEVMKGKHYTGTVLLVESTAEVPIAAADWLFAAPEIYRRFTKSGFSDGKTEKA
jgi:hypothetical protein